MNFSRRNLESVATINGGSWTTSDAASWTATEGDSSNSSQYSISMSTGFDGRCRQGGFGLGGSGQRRDRRRSQHHHRHHHHTDALPAEELQSVNRAPCTQRVPLPTFVRRSLILLQVSSFTSTTTILSSSSHAFLSQRAAVECVQRWVRLDRAAMVLNEVSSVCASLHLHINHTQTHTLKRTPACTRAVVCANRRDVRGLALWVCVCMRASACLHGRSRFTVFRGDVVVVAAVELRQRLGRCTIIAPVNLWQAPVAVNGQANYIIWQ